MTGGRSRSNADGRPRQISFVDNYLELKVGWKAAEAAGYSGNRFQLSSIASENLSKPNILAYYAERLRLLQVSSDEVLAEIGAVARIPLDAEIQAKTGVRVNDKLKALELAGKVHRLFAEKDTEISLSDGDVDRLSDSIIRSMMEAASRRRLEAAPITSIEPTD